MIENCDSCLNANLQSFTCYWCSELGKCSDSFDRLRQSWMRSGCPYNVSGQLLLTQADWVVLLSQAR